MVARIHALHQALSSRSVRAKCEVRNVLEKVPVRTNARLNM